MATSNLRKKEPVNAPRGPGRVRRTARWLSHVCARLGARLGARLSPRRLLEVAGLLLGLAVGATLVLVLRPFGGHEPAARPPAGRGDDTVVRQYAIGPVPAALDAEWAAYSDQSTCGDWAGGDGISAVRLSTSQIAWFYSDTYLGPASPSSGFAHSAGLVHNSVVIQTASGQGSRFVTLTGGGVCSFTARPAAVVGPPQAPGASGDRYWEEDGIEVGGTIVKFYNRYPPGNAPYIPNGTLLAAYPASQLSAAGRGPAYGQVIRPRLIPLPSYAPRGGGGSPIVWGASVLRIGNMIYVYGTQTPDTPVPYRQLYLAQVPASRLTQFTAWRFYAGDGRWAAGQRHAAPLQTWGSPLSVSSGFSVVQAGQRYWLIQADPIAGSQDIDAYPAGAVWGPFDQRAGIVLYRDPGIGLDAAHDYRIMYEARVEPAVSTSQTLVISYNVNSIGNTAGCIPMSWFSNTVTLPRFISVPMAILSAAPGSPRSEPEDTITTGPSDFPRVAARDPSQWFSEWDYSNGCPPVPGVTRVQARPRADEVRLSWPDAGLGVAYRVYLRPPGAAGYVLKTTVPFVLSATARSVSATLSGLPPGKYVARVVPLNLRIHAGRAAQVAFTVPGG